MNGGVQSDADKMMQCADGSICGDVSGGSSRWIGLRTAARTVYASSLMRARRADRVSAERRRSCSSCSWRSRSRDGAFAVLGVVDPEVSRLLVGAPPEELELLVQEDAPTFTACSVTVKYDSAPVPCRLQQALR